MAVTSLITELQARLQITTLTETQNDVKEDADVAFTLQSPTT